MKSENGKSAAIIFIATLILIIAVFGLSALQFDPKIADIMLGLLRDGKIRIAE